MKPNSLFKTISSQSNLILDAFVITNSGLLTSDSSLSKFSFSIFYGNDQSTWTQLSKNISSNFIIPTYQANQLIISANLFQNYSNYWTFWRVDLNVTDLNGFQLGMSSSYFQVNKPPNGGNCSFDQLNGTSLSTNFTISCKNWTDPDGFIT